MDVCMYDIHLSKITTKPITKSNRVLTNRKVDLREEHDGRQEQQHMTEIAQLCMSHKVKCENLKTKTMRFYLVFFCNWN